MNKIYDKYTNSNDRLSNKVTNDSSMVISFLVVAKSNKVGVIFSNVETFLILILV